MAVAMIVMGSMTMRRTTSPRISAGGEVVYSKGPTWLSSSDLLFCGARKVRSAACMHVIYLSSDAALPLCLLDLDLDLDLVCNWNWFWNRLH